MENTSVFQKSGKICEPINIYCAFPSLWMCSELSFSWPFFNQDSEYVCYSIENLGINSYTAWVFLHIDWPHESFVSLVQGYLFEVFKKTTKKKQRNWVNVVLKYNKVTWRKYCDMLIRGKKTHEKTNQNPKLTEKYRDTYLVGILCNNI